MSLQNASDALRATLLDLLWAQWTDLGVAGVRGSGQAIVDPEALALVTLEIGRFDPRLFDEVLDWLARNGDLLDVTRLRRLIGSAAPEHQRLARVLIDFMRRFNISTKWAPLSDRWQVNEASATYSPTPLFRDPAGSGLPVFGNPDPFFASYGFIRPPLVLRGMSVRPRPNSPWLVRLAARSLVGIGVRAEVLLYLWTHEAAHGRLIAARTGYSQRQVSEYLAGLAAAGFAERYPQGKSVQYRLVPGIRWSGAQQSRYVDWARAFPALAAAYAGLACAAQASTTYEASTQVRSTLAELRSALPVEGLELPLPRPGDYPGEAVLGHAEEVARAVSAVVEALARASTG
ncbi:MAG: hypothetical protein ABFC80_06580 [Coriobacteriales bacterium]|nr:hypothetical protein [Actinomycetes bacterium]